MLALVGGALGVILAIAAQPLLVRLVPNGLPVTETPQLDLRMLLWAVGLTMATALGFGVAPAMRVARGATASGLREGAREGSSRRTERIRTGLVVAEVDGVGGAAGIRGPADSRASGRCSRSTRGFGPEGVLTARTWLQGSQLRVH